MKYSETILSDENFDDELEKLLNVIGECGKEFDGFVDKLDNSFAKQKMIWVLTNGYQRQRDGTWTYPQCMPEFRKLAKKVSLRMSSEMVL